MGTTDRLRVVVATPMKGELCARIQELEPRIELVYDDSLMPRMRWAADYEGDPSFTRTKEQQAKFEAIIDTADALLGVPDWSPAALARTVRANPRLRWVHTMAAGGGAQVKAAKLTQEELSRVTFTTSAGVHGSPLAEFAVFGVLAGAKTLPRLLEQQQRKEWSGRWCMSQIDEMTVAVLGMGGIGRQIAAKLQALGANIIEIGRPVIDAEGNRGPVRAADLAEAVAKADALAIALPGTDATHLLVNADVLAAARPGITIVNVGRGTVIDEAALLDALNSGQVGFAALDVFYTEPLPETSPLWAHPNVLVSPHTAGLNEAEERRIAELFAKNATLLLDGLPPLNIVDTVEFY